MVLGCRFWGSQANDFMTRGVFRIYIVELNPASGTGTVSLAYYVIPVVFHRIFVQMIKRYHLRTLI